jgi:multiple sugar transport system permease protein
MNLPLRATTSSIPSSNKRRKNRKEQYLAWAFASPALILLSVFLVIPFFLAIYFSLTNQRLAPDPLPTAFLGLSNYTRMLTDYTLRQALFNNSFFGIVVVPVETGLALLLALLLNQKLRGMAVFRAFFFTPVVTPLAVISVVWAFLYNPGQGTINAFLHTISFGHLGPYPWLDNVNLALPAIMALSIWQGVGLYMIIYLAGLQNIPESFYEAAKVDGAGRWHQLWYITLPQLRNTTLFVMIATTVQAFKLYTQVEVMTQGGPGNATVTVVWDMVNQGIHQLHVGYASAIAVVFFLIVLIRIIPVLRYVVAAEKREV